MAPLFTSSDGSTGAKALNLIDDYFVCHSVVMRHDLQEKHRQRHYAFFTYTGMVKAAR